MVAAAVSDHDATQEHETKSEQAGPEKLKVVSIKSAITQSTTEKKLRCWSLQNIRRHPGSSALFFP
jgi:hypothetical protein